MKKQSGSAHAVVIVILIVALLGTLGWIFYQNFVLKKPITTQPTSTNKSVVKNDNKQQVKLITGSIDKDFDTNFSFQYPATWTYKSAIYGEKPDNWQENIKITSPSKKIRVNYNIAKGGGFGGACDPEEPWKVDTINYKILPNFSNASLMELTSKDIRSIYSDIGSGLFSNNGEVALYNTSVLKNIKAGSSLCELYLRNLITLNEEKMVSMYEASVVGIDEKGDEQSLAVSDRQGDEYNQAESILLSTSAK